MLGVHEYVKQKAKVIDKTELIILIPYQLSIK